MYPWPSKQCIIDYVSIDDLKLSVLNRAGRVDWEGDFSFCYFAGHVKAVEDSEGGYDLIEQAKLFYYT